MSSPNPFLGQDSPQDHPTSINGGVRLPVATAQRARGLKVVLICELVLALWLLFFGSGGILAVIIVVPTNIIGFYGAHLLRRNLLTAFIVLKSVVVFLVCFSLATLIIAWSNCGNCGSMSGEIPILTILYILVTIYQLLCIVIARRIRYAIAVAETTPQGNFELNQVDIQQPSPSARAPQNVPVYPYPQYAPYSMPYMPQDGQGYTVMPYGYGYPPNNQAQPPMAAVYPYMYPQQQEDQAQPTYVVPPQQPATPSEKDSDTLLKNIDLNNKYDH